MTNLVQPVVPAALRGGHRKRIAPLVGPTGRGSLPFGWLLFALVFAAWYPIDPWWQSDDFIALHYSQDLGRTLSDFTGNQYGLEGVVWFYRPLITLSFWLEQTLFGGPNPLVSHLSNTVAHALSACLVGAIGTRFLGQLRGFLAGLVWGLAPTHTAAIFWAAGRVDSHTMVWMALACLLHLRWLEGRTRTRVPAAALLVLALCSKEQAIAVPGAMLLLGFCLASSGERLRVALTAWPAIVIVALYLGMRLLLFGRMGGYEATNIAPLEAARGLGASALTLSNPMWRMGGSVVELPGYAPWLAFVPVAIAVGWSIVQGRFGFLAACAIAFLGLAVPALPFWGQTENVATLRYYYVPFVACACVFAAGGILPVVLVLAVFALPTVEQHRDWFAAYREAETYHRALIEDADRITGEPLFVSGLPRVNERRNVIEFHLGVDRLLRPPFVQDEGRTVLALRPLDARPDAMLVPFGDDRGLPFDAPTLAFAGREIRSLLPRARIPDCEVELEGGDSIATADLIALHEGRKSIHIVVRGVRAGAFRVTIFTAGGYVSAILPDRGAAGSADGAVDVAELLHARYVTSPGPDQAHVAFALAIPTTFDLEPAFPTLVEALQDGATTHANRRPLVLRFDRRLDDFLHGRE